MSFLWTPRRQTQRTEKRMAYGNDQSAYNPLAEKLKSFSQGQDFYFSTDTATIVTTEDRLFKILTMYQEILEGRKFWIAPLGIGATIIGTLVTTDKYRAFMGIPSEFWFAIFVVSLVACAFWFLKLAYGLKNHVKVLWSGNSVDYLIGKIKEDSERWLQSDRSQGGNGRTNILGSYLTHWLAHRNLEDQDEP